MAPSEPIPRYSLYCLPLMKTISPGLSSQPASRLPSMTASAPAAMAFAMSPEYCSPPLPPPGHHAGGADRPRPDADLDAVRSRVHQCLRAGPGGDVAADHLGIRIGLDLGDHVQHGLRVAVRGIHHEEIRARLGQRLRAALSVLADAHRGADHQAAG